jgi:hypothetical protein
MNPFLHVITALNGENVRYVVVGGFAAIMHGVPRVTGDIDLIIDLAPQEAARAIRALLTIGLRSPLPVDPVQFADPATRRAWISDKGMSVFSLFDPSPGGPTVDLFVENPIPFDDLLARSVLIRLQGQPVRVCSVEDLITLKEQSNRPLDLEDVRTLRALQSSTEPSPAVEGDP